VTWVDNLKDKIVVDLNKQIIISCAKL